MRKAVSCLSAVGICQISRLWRSIHHIPADTTTDIMIAKMNPNLLVSIPLTRFMPNSEDMSVGNISITENEVSVRITVFMLLLMMLE